MTKKGIDLEKHKRILSQILIDIVKLLNNKIAFKGGTSAMMFYNLPRMSLDLDFDLFENLTSEELDKLDILLRKYGDIKDFSLKRFTIFFLLDYEKNNPNIKIELNKRIWKNNSYKIVWLLGSGIKIADEKTTLSNKLVAVTERKLLACRDIFDINYFLEMGYQINKELIKERTKQDFNIFINYLVETIENKYNKNNILHGMGEVLDEGQKNWAKEYLLKDTIDKLNKIKD